LEQKNLQLLKKFNNKIFSFANQEKGCIKENISSWEALFSNNKPKFFGKIGQSELRALEFYFRKIKMPFPKSFSWERPADRLFHIAGVFPKSKNQFETFCNIYLESLKDIDGLYLWQNDPFLRAFEKRVASFFCSKAVSLSSELISHQTIFELHKFSWLVVSPFADLMAGQLKKLGQIHPQIAEKKTRLARCEFLKCPLHSHLEKSPFNNWNEALDALVDEASTKSFELAIVGAGAWSLPFLAKLKKVGKSGIHLGGDTQLIFGISGKRWDTYGIYNDHWIRPPEPENLQALQKIDQGSYW